MKSVWDQEYRAALARARTPYLRLRRRIVVVLAVSTPLYAAIAVAGYAMRDSQPGYAAFAYAAPVLLVANWGMAILNLRRAARSRDSSLRELDAEYRAWDPPSTGEERRQE